MPNLSFTCINCNVQIECDAGMAGSAVQCPSCGASLMVPRQGLHEGLEIGGFQLECKIGAGAMGEVWLAHQTSMGRKVALKILSPNLTRDPEFVDQFMREVRNSGRLQHNNIVTAFDAGVAGDIYYLAMSYVDGESLEDRIHRAGKIPEKEALKIICAVANGLSYAWKNYQMIHRDIKPSNIMLDRNGEPKLMDMGVSKSLSEDASLTMSGTIMGTPHYISPEQVSAEDEIDFRSDLYSLGVTLFHMLDGKVPFDAKSSIAVMTKHLTDAPPLLHSLNPAISKPCEVLVQIMMAKKKEERQLSWDDLIRDINLVLDGEMPATQLSDGHLVNNTEKISRVINKRQQFKLPKARLHLEKAAVHESSAPLHSKSSKLPLIIGVAAILAVVLIIVFVVMSNSSKAAAEKNRAEEQKRQEDTRRIEEAAKKAELDKKKSEEDAANLERSHQELWDAASKSADQALADKSHFETAISNFEKIKTGCKGTRFESMAGAEIAKLVKVKNDLEDDKRRNKEEEKRVADEAAKKIKAENPQSDGRKITEMLDAVASDIMKEDYKSASAKFAEDPSLLPELKGVLEPLAKSDEIILASLQKDTGSMISLGVENKTVKSKIRKVEGGFIYCEQTLGKAMMVNKYALKDLNCEEKIKRLSAVNPIAGSVLKGVSEVKTGKLDDAMKSCESCGALCQPMKDKIDEIRCGRIEAAATKDFEKLLARSESVTRMTEKDIGDFLKSIESFPEVHKTAKFAAEKADELAKLSESANSALEALKGKSAPREKISAVAPTSGKLLSKNVSGKIIMLDDFNYDDPGSNVLLSERTSAPTNLTGSKWQLVAGDGEYEVRIRGSALKPDSPNQASFHNVASSGLSISGKGSYVKPVKMLVRADLRFGDTSCEYILLGFYSSLPGGRMMKPMTAFTGLKLNIDGSLVLVENGIEGKSIKWAGGAFDPVTFKTLTYTVSTANGSISDVSLSGSRGTYDFTSKSFTDTATAYLGIGGLGHSGHGEGYILIDNLVLSDIGSLSPANKNKNDTKSGTGSAQVKVENAKFAALEAGSPVFGFNDKFKWDLIPAVLNGTSYSLISTNNHAVTEFQVLKGGKLFMSAKWSEITDADQAKEITSRDQLVAGGWRSEGFIEGAYGKWEIFSKECKSGEKFKYKTSQHLPPIVFVNP